MAITFRPNEVRNRLQALSVIVLVMYGILVVRLVYLQAVRGQYYEAKVRGEQTKRFREPADRGDIEDSAGRPLGINHTTAQLVVDPTLVKDPLAVAQAVAPLVGCAPEKLVPALSDTTQPDGEPNRRAILHGGLTPEMVERIQVAQDASGPGGLLSPIAVTEKVTRMYPLGREAVHVVGFVRNHHDVPTGAGGIESKYQEALAGVAGKGDAELDAHRRVIPGTGNRTAAVDGQIIRLTLDSTVQHIAYTELRKCVAKHTPKGATVIVLDPQTGAVLAMVSEPSFDPQKRPALGGLDGAAYINLALVPYEPGSTGKPFPIAGALQDGRISDTTTLVCTGARAMGGRTVRCAAHGGSAAHGTLTPRGVIARSCNICTGLIGMMLGMDRLEYYLDAFGLLEPSGVGLPGDTGGTLQSGAATAERGDSKVTRVSFGQSVMVSPIGLATAYGAIANDGELMQTHIVKARYTHDRQLVEETQPTVVRQVLTPAVAARMQSYLREVVKTGTGRAAAVPGYTVAGKTGTAQKVVQGVRGYAPGKYVASFVGYVPARNPRAVILVAVDEPRNGHFGADVAAPVFKRIAQRLMWSWHVAPDDPASLVARRSDH